MDDPIWRLYSVDPALLFMLHWFLLFMNSVFTWVFEEFTLFVVSQVSFWKCISMRRPIQKTDCGNLAKKKFIFKKVEQATIKKEIT